MRNTSPHFSWAKLKKGREFASVPMNANLAQRKTGDSIDNRVISPQTQTGSSGDKIPPSVKPTYQGPADNDPLLYTVPLVPGMHQASLLQKDYHASQGNQGKDGSLYHGKN